MRKSGLLLASMACAVLLASGLALAQTVPGAGGSPQTGSSEGEVVPGELIVILDEEAPSAAPRAVAEDAGASVRGTIPDLDAGLLSFPEIKEAGDEGERERALAEVKAEVEADPRVESVSYNGIVRASLRPNDPALFQQYGVVVIRALQAWNVAIGEGATIAVIDTGVQDDHPEIAGKVVAQQDFVDDDDTAQDDAEHGTHVAGIAAATMNNNEGFAGVCPGCDLVVGRVLNASGTGTEFDVAQGIDYAVDNGADVVNLSLGSPKPDPVLERAVNQAWNAGAVVVGATGNEGSKKVGYPAAYPKAIAVGATDVGDDIVWFSNRGRAVDLAAPGKGVYSSVPTDAYASYSGTSMSVPHVAGVAGLLASQGLDNERIRERLECTAKDLGADGRDDLYGHGRVDAYAAVSETCAEQPAPPETAGCTITGNNRDNTIRGTDRRDVICARGGDDTLLGRGGNDTLLGHGGKDVLLDVKGKGLLKGGDGNDVLFTLDDAPLDTMNGQSGSSDLCLGDNGDVRKNCERGSLLGLSGEQRERLDEAKDAAGL